MKKIFIIHPDAQHSHYTAVALSSLGHEVTFLTGRDLSVGISSFMGYRSELRKYKTITLAPYLYLLVGFLRKFFRGSVISKWAYKKYLNIFNNRAFLSVKLINPDVVIVYDTLSGSLISQIFVDSFSRPQVLVDMSAPLYTSHLFNSYDPDPDNIFKNELDCDNWRVTNSIIEIRMADIFLVASQYSSIGLMNAGVSKDKIFICPYGNKLERQDKLCDEDKSTLDDVDLSRGIKIVNFLYVGNVSIQKGVHRLLSSVLKINTAGLEFKINLTLVGDDSYFQNKRPEFSWLHIKGRLCSSDVEDVYQNNAAFVFPSLSDGFGFVVLEALSLGLPVLCSSHSGASDLINKSNGVIFDPRDSESFVKNLTSFARNVLEKKYNSTIISKSVEIYNWKTYQTCLKDALASKDVFVD